MGNPTIFTKNQFGEAANSYILGGSSQLSCNFIVDSTNGNGLGIRSLKGSPQIANVYMATSSTPAAGNPNPLAGYVLVEFNAGFNGYLSGFSGFVSPVSGTPINISSGLTIGQAYVIVSVGTSTAANWQVVGLLPGAVPTVGQAFIAKTSSAGTGTGVVEVPLATGAGINSIQIVGDPNQTCATTTGGAWIVLQLMAPTSSGSTVPVATAPAPGSVLGLNFIFGNQIGQPNV